MGTWWSANESVNSSFVHIWIKNVQIFQSCQFADMHHIIFEVFVWLIITIEPEFYKIRHSIFDIAKSATSLTKTIAIIQFLYL